MNKQLTDMFEENFEDFQISELSGTAVLPSYAKAAIVLGVDGDQPKLPKILSKRNYNTNFSQFFKQSKIKSTPKSTSREAIVAKSKSRSVSKSKEGSKSKNVKDYFILNHKKINLEQKIIPKNKQKWKQQPSNRKATVQQLRQNVYKKEFKECTFQPKVNRKNNKLNFTSKQFGKSNKTKRQGTVFDRLYKKDKQLSIGQRSLPTVADKTAKSTRRESPIEDYLYSDALRRRGRETLLERKQFKSNTNTTFDKSIKNDRMAGERFIKEYSAGLENLDFHQKKLLSIIQVHKLLLSLNFIHTKKLVENHPQNTLIYQIYEVLGGNIQNGVRIRNLLIFLLAVNGIFNIQQANIHDPLRVDIRGVYVESQLGLLISQQGALLMNQQLGRKIHKYFEVLYRNRLSRLKTHDKKNTNGENKQNQDIEIISKQRTLKSKQSKKSSAVNSKRQSQTLINQNRKQPPIATNFRKPDEPLANVPNPTYQTHQSMFSQQNQIIELQNVFNIQNYSAGITLEIELRDGTIQDLTIKSPKEITEAVRQFCQTNCLDSESEDQVLQVAHEAFQCADL